MHLLKLIKHRHAKNVCAKVFFFMELYFLFSLIFLQGDQNGHSKIKVFAGTKYCITQLRDIIDCMVLIFDGNSEIGTNVLSDFGYLFCLRHLIRSRVVTNLIFSSSEITSFFAPAQHILRRSYISTLNQPKHVWLGSGSPYFAQTL